MGGISDQSGSGRSVRRLVHTINPERSTIPEPSTAAAAVATRRRPSVRGGGGAAPLGVCGGGAPRGGGA